MIHRSPTLLLCGLVTLTIFLIFWVPSLILLSSKNDGINKSLAKDSWIVRLVINLLGYCTILVPGYFLLQYVKSNGFSEQSFPKYVATALQLCFFGHETEKPKLEEGVPADNVHRGSHEKSMSQEARMLLLCVLGLQGSYLTWGLLQEKIMTKDYIDHDGTTEKFKDSQFLVFVNRILAFILSGTYIFFTRQRLHVAPLYKYSYCSFSNIMSSWCQYEALKYVSFPTQVLAKASKIIPVMVMGKLVSRKSYEYYEYVTAVVMSVGMTLFLLGSTEELKRNTVTTFSGVVILVGYMAFDSFTSNWQSELFTQYKMSSVQMMCGVNLFSCLFTAVSLIQQGGFIDSFSFMVAFPPFIFDIIILSLCSALGQLFIFLTIAQFGAVVFVIIMTVRQGLAILLSCFIYSHPVTVLGVLGILVVFASIFVRIYCSQRLKAIRKQKAFLSTDGSKV